MAARPDLLVQPGTFIQAGNKFRRPIHITAVGNWRTVGGIPTDVAYSLNSGAPQGPSLNNGGVDIILDDLTPESSNCLRVWTRTVMKVLTFDVPALPKPETPKPASIISEDLGPDPTENGRHKLRIVVFDQHGKGFSGVTLTLVSRDGSAKSTPTTPDGQAFAHAPKFTVTDRNVSLSVDGTNVTRKVKLIKRTK